MSVWPNGCVFVYELSGSEFESSCSHLDFIFRACFEQGILDIQATIEYGFTLKRVRDVTRTYSKGFQSSIYWNEYNTESEDKEMTNE